MTDASLGSRIHGGVRDDELARFGLSRGAVLDLSVNVNPWGPHPAVQRAIQAADLSSYPPPRAASACEAIARSCGVRREQVIVGHGSTELLWCAVSLLCGSPRPLLIAGPTFSEPASAAAAWGVRTVELRSSARDQFALDLPRLSQAITAHDAAGVYLCQPNNPDGGMAPVAQLRELCELHPRCLFVLDQAFLALSERYADAAVQFGDNVLVVRSLTKEHALPGLRVGYALGAPAWIERLEARRPTWMVSAPAQAAVIAACEQTQYVQQVRGRLLEGKRALASGCEALGLTVLPSHTHFFLLHAPGADALRERLLARHGVAVRSGSSFGLPDYVRVAGCGPDERARALAAFAAELRS